MKSVVMATVIAVLIVAGSIWYESGIHRVSDDLFSMNEGVKTALEDNDFEGAREKMDNIYLYLDKKRAALSATDNHEAIDKIELSLNELYEYIKGGHKTDALSKCSMLEFLYKHLPKDYEMKLENIL